MTGWLLRRVLRRASSAEHAGFAARILPALDGAVPRTRSGAEFVRASCADQYWAARYLAARTLGRMVPDLIGVEEAWGCLLGLAADEVAAVREGAAFGVADVVSRCPGEAARLERLVVDTAAPSAGRKVALRSLIPLATDPCTAELAERLLAAAARAGGWVAAGVGPLIVGRGIRGRDPQRAARILGAWATSDDAVLRDQAARARRRMPADAGASAGRG